MKKTIYLGSAAVLAMLAAAGPALTTDIFHSRWNDQASAAVDTAQDVAFSTASDAARMVTPVVSVTSDSFAGLLRIDDDTTLSVAPNVSQVPLSTVNVRKIGYGHVETVEIVTTATGTYSSDGLASPHVLYPGVEAKSTARKGFETLFALIGGNWAPLTLGRAGSFTTYGSGFGTSYMTDGNMTCIAGKGYSGCI